jgi:hypothetical protein
VQNIYSAIHCKYYVTTFKLRSATEQMPTDIILLSLSTHIYYGRN